jgi:hypothetical protein
MFRIFLLVLAFIFAPITVAEPFWGSKASEPVDTDPKKLKAGQFIWKGHDVASGAVVALVSIPEQRLYLYRNGVLIGISTVSTGKRGYGTPVGIFTVLEKDRHHRSRTYDNAPMPYANRLTWQGVALHAGHVLGRPASHGCIRLPSQFARLLFDVSTLGMTVVIMGYQNQTLKFSHPTVLSPVDSDERSTINLTDLTPTEEFRWQPENTQEGSISIIMSEADQYLLVYRKGIEIGRAKISMTLSEKHLGTYAFILQEGEATETNLLLNHRWMSTGIPLYSNKETVMLTASFFDHLNIPIDFAKALDSFLTSGTTLLITDKPMLRPPQLMRKASAPQPRCIKGNCVHGQGIQIYVDGSKYIGQFKNGLSEGQGQLIFPNGEKYVGNFRNDKFQWD